MKSPDVNNHFRNSITSPLSEPQPMPPEKINGDESESPQVAETTTGDRGSVSSTPSEIDAFSINYSFIFIFAQTRNGDSSRTPVSRDGNGLKAHADLPGKELECMPTSYGFKFGLALDVQ
jgi:hypothetical protein